ncbi:MAG: phosphatase PAP2 family protein [Chloroflexota bacterium]
MGNQGEEQTRRTLRRAMLPVLAVAGIAFTCLAVIVRRWPSTRADLQVTKAFQSTEHQSVERAMSLVSWFGFRPQSLLLPLSVVTGFWWWGRRIEAALLVVAWGSSMLSFLTKQVVRRPRPDGEVVRVVVANIRDTSFPSGHVLHYVVFWGFVAYLLLIQAPWSGVRWFVGLVMGPVIALVGPSRIYLGHHWFTDVLGSYLLGSAYLAGLIELHTILREFEPAESSDLPDGPAAGARQWLR